MRILWKCPLAVCLALLLTGSARAAAGTNDQQLTFAHFNAWLQPLKTNHFREKILSADEIYRLKRTAETLSDASWAAILQLWVVGEVDYVKLLWWQKDDTETRAFIVALEWCQLALPAKEDDPWPGGIDNFEGMSRRFDGPERALRLRETDFVRAHRGTI